VDTTQSSLAHDGLGVRTEDDAVVITQIKITIQGGEEEHSEMADGGDGQKNTGASPETTQEGPDITPANGKTLVPSASTNDTLVNSMANTGSGARTKVEDASTDQGVIVSQGENAEQSRMAGGGAGQHTTARRPDRARYRPGQGLTKFKGRHRRRAHRLRLRITQHQSRWDPRGPRQIRRDGAWVRREQTRGSWDPSAGIRCRVSLTRCMCGTLSTQKCYEDTRGSKEHHYISCGQTFCVPWARGRVHA